MERLFHISEEPEIKIFHPRQSPQHYDSIKGNVVFAISDKLLHNYLLPRDCPRVAYYSGPETTLDEKKKFFGKTSADYIINVESCRKDEIEKAVLYKYKFKPENFILLDETAGYYISYKPEIPLSISEITNLSSELEKRNAELRFTDNLIKLADEVSKSRLKFSIIRLKNSER